MKLMKTKTFVTIFVFFGMLLLTSCSPAKPDEQRLKNDLVGQSIYGNVWGVTVKSLDQITNLQILYKTTDPNVLDYTIEAVIEKSDSKHSPFVVKGSMIYKKNDKGWVLAENKVKVKSFSN